MNLKEFLKESPGKTLTKIFGRISERNITNNKSVEKFRTFDFLLESLKALLKESVNVLLK